MKWASIKNEDTGTKYQEMTPVLFQFHSWINKPIKNIG